MKTFKATNCLPYTAWHDWQHSGFDFVMNNPDATKHEVDTAAGLFSMDTAGLGPHDAVYAARHNAFMEGVHND